MTEDERWWQAFITALAQPGSGSEQGDDATIGRASRIADLSMKAFYDRIDQNQKRDRTIQDAIYSYCMDSYGRFNHKLGIEKGFYRGFEFK